MADCLADWLDGLLPLSLGGLSAWLADLLTDWQAG